MKLNTANRVQDRTKREDVPDDNEPVVISEMPAPETSPLGERLSAIRAEYIASGGKPYTHEEIEDELAQARRTVPLNRS